MPRGQSEFITCSSGVWSEAPACEKGRLIMICCVLGSTLYKSTRKLSIYLNVRRVKEWIYLVSVCDAGGLVVENAELINPNARYPVGYIAVFRCTDGYISAGCDKNYLMCNVRGLWEGQAECIPRCKI